MTKDKPSWIARFPLVPLVLVLGACGGEDADGPADPLPQNVPPSEHQVLQSQKQRITAPATVTPELRKLVAGNSDFAWALYHSLTAKEDGNLFYSPQSISQALAMTYAGARNNTEQQMERVLRFTLGQSGVHPAFNQLDQAMASRGTGAKGKDGKGFRLKVANAAWGQTGYGFMQAYLDILAEYYGAGMYLLDFASWPEPSRKIINSWVAQNTEGKITELLERNTIDGTTRLVLTNTVYFNAAWDKVFPQELSRPGDFNLLDGKKVQVPTMTQAETFPYAGGSGYQAVELPYDGKELSMVIVVPDAGQLATIENKLSAQFVDSVAGSLAPTGISLTLPKWQVRSKLKLKDHLEAMGMTDAFDGRADFSGINGGAESLYITDVIHEATVSVDEKGTEAAAATAVPMSWGVPPSVTVDRPFIYLIRDIATGSVVFVGRVVDPR
jgi:serpin B